MISNVLWAYVLLELILLRRTFLNWLEIESMIWLDSKHWKNIFYSLISAAQRNHVSNTQGEDNMLTEGTCQFSALLSFYMNITVLTLSSFPFCRKWEQGSLRILVLRNKTQCGSYDFRKKDLEVYHKVSNQTFCFNVKRWFL